MPTGPGLLQTGWSNLWKEGALSLSLSLGSVCFLLGRGRLLQSFEGRARTRTTYNEGMDGRGRTIVKPVRVHALTHWQGFISQNRDTGWMMFRANK